MTSTVYLYILLLPFSFTAYIFLLIVKIKMPFLNMTSNGGLNTSIFMIGLKNKIRYFFHSNVSTIFLTLNCLMSMQRVLWIEMMTAVSF